MEHFWERLPGFFTFPDFYRWVARQMPRERARLVEVGVYAGQSAAFLAVELLNAGNGHAVLDLVDLCHGGVDNVLRDLAPVRHMIGDFHQENSWDAARHYDDGSLDFVFLDADHGYESIRKDIDAWLPKVRQGSILAGHDYGVEFPGVLRAVNETFARFDVWRGSRDMGDQRMKETGNYYPVWAVRV